jgi:UDP-N-acetyl-2-amino-2-deoxyglucuronate dehydrogenase
MGRPAAQGADPMNFSHEYHRAVLNDFLDAVTLDRVPEITGRGALAAHRLIEAILGSSVTGKRQPI